MSIVHELYDDGQSRSIANLKISNKKIIVPLVMNNSGGKGNLSPKLFLVKFHPDNITATEVEQRKA
jgi:hypothetical protein